MPNHFRLSPNILFCLLFFSSVSFSAFGQKLRRLEKERYSEAELRMQRRIGAEFHTNLNGAKGATLFLNMSPKLQWLMSYYGTQIQDNEASDSYNDASYTSLNTGAEFQKVEAQARWFMSDNLYLTGGLGKFSYQEIYALRYQDTEIVRKIRFRTQGYSASAGIGIQWSWASGLILGIEIAEISYFMFRHTEVKDSRPDLPASLEDFKVQRSAFLNSAYATGYLGLKIGYAI